jgi:hypothetical protein
MRVTFIVLIGLQAAMCCTVVEPSVRDAVKQAEIVFRGSITEISESAITFRVERVWKGHVPAVFSMPKVVWSSTPCMPGFYQRHVRTGAELLVYARRMPGMDGTGYVPSPGSRTAPVSNAIEDLKKLGAGRPPTSDVIGHPAIR